MSIIHSYIESTNPLHQMHLLALAGASDPSYDVFVDNMTVFSKLCERLSVREKPHFVKKAVERLEGVPSISIEEAKQKVKQSLSEDNLPLVVWALIARSVWGQETIHPHAMVIYGITSEDDRVYIHDPNAWREEVSLKADLEYHLADLFTSNVANVTWLTTFQR